MKIGLPCQMEVWKSDLFPIFLLKTKKYCSLTQLCNVWKPHAPSWKKGCWQFVNAVFAGDLQIRKKARSSIDDNMMAIWHIHLFHFFVKSNSSMLCLCLFHNLVFSTIVPSDDWFGKRIRNYWFYKSKTKMISHQWNS